jgi:hypothetical protein
MGLLPIKPAKVLLSHTGPDKEGNHSKLELSVQN